MRFIIISMLAMAAFVLAADHAQAQTREMLGQQDWIRYIQPVDAKGPSGEPLHLARRLRTENFLFPYMIADEGYVLVDTVRPETLALGQYIPLTPEKTRELQAGKLLPDPLPSYEMSAADRFNGYSFWLYCVCLAAAGALTWYRRSAGRAAGA